MNKGIGEREEIIYLKKKQQLIKWATVSFALFPLAVLAINLAAKQLAPSFPNIIDLYSTNPVHWAILVLSLAAVTFTLLLKDVATHSKQMLNKYQQDQEIEMNKMGSLLTQLEAGNFSDEKQIEDSQLVHTINSLKTKLIKQKQDDERGKWASEGLSKFAEILRVSENLNSLSDELIKNIVKYVGLNQGSIFVCEKNSKEETVLALKACYAYDRKKYLTKTIAPGEGLVGQCYLENDTIILKQVPADYIKITSGLGEATPKFISLIPIKSNDVIEGVLEVAGFKELQTYQVKFLEKVCEAFASVLRSIKSNDETRTLLEATKKQTEQLLSQEEEIRQNLEEMMATQEQLTRQLTENKQIRERVERRERVMALTTILSETDPYGTITFVNDKFCEVSKYTPQELIGKPQNIVRHPDMPKELFELFWKMIKRGNVFNGIVKNRAKDGSAYWVDATIVPVVDEHGQILKYTGARYHITDEELAVKLYNKQAEKFGWPKLKYGKEIQLPISENIPMTMFN